MLRQYPTLVHTLLGGKYGNMKGKGRNAMFGAVSCLVVCDMSVYVVVAEHRKIWKIAKLNKWTQCELKEFLGTTPSDTDPASVRHLSSESAPRTRVREGRSSNGGARP